MDIELEVSGGGIDIVVTIFQMSWIDYISNADPNLAPLFEAFPITHTRSDKSSVSEINEFRKWFYDRYTVFDPLTIDEYPLADSALKKLEQHVKIQIADMVAMTEPEIAVHIDLFRHICKIGLDGNEYDIVGNVVRTKG